MPRGSDARTGSGVDDAFVAALAEIYRHVDQAVAGGNSTCRACGKCCHFETAGHRLYVSAGELMYLASSGAPPDGASGVLRCPYQVGPACSAGPRRPLGCRTYFCDPAARALGRRAYEPSHRRIKALHEAHGLPYEYLELTGAIRAMPGRA